MGLSSSEDDVTCRTRLATIDIGSGKSISYSSSDNSYHGFSTLLFVTNEVEDVFDELALGPWDAATAGQLREEDAQLVGVHAGFVVGLADAD